MMLPKPRPCGPGPGHLCHIGSALAPSPPGAEGPEPHLWQATAISHGHPMGIWFEPQPLVALRGSARTWPNPPASFKAPYPAGSAPSPSALPASFPQGTPPLQFCINTAPPYLFCCLLQSLDLSHFLPPNSLPPPREGTTVRCSLASAQRHREISKGCGGWR